MRTQLLALAALALTAVPAQATPYVGAHDYLSTGTVAITGADGGTWSLTVGATESGAAESRPEQFLYVDLRRCAANSCTPVGRWVAPLVASQVSVHPALTPDSPSYTSDGRLAAVLGGQALTLSLAGESITGSRFTVVPSPVTENPHMTNFSQAGGTLRLGRLTCTIAPKVGEIGNTVDADSIGKDTRFPRTPLPAVLPAGFLTGAHAPHC